MGPEVERKGDKHHCEQQAHLERSLARDLVHEAVNGMNERHTLATRDFECQLAKTALGVRVHHVDVAEVAGETANEAWVGNRNAESRRGGGGGKIRNRG